MVCGDHSAINTPAPKNEEACGHCSFYVNQVSRMAEAAARFAQRV